MNIANDLRFALRQMVRRPGFALAVVLTLAIGIGANSTMFSIVNGVLLQPLPYADPDRLVVVANSYPGMGFERAGTSIPDYLDRREGVRAFEESALWYDVSAGVSTGSMPNQYTGVLTTSTFFSTLQVGAALGRTFTADDMQPGNDQVVILSHSLWQELFAGSPGAVGSDLRIDGMQRRIVGIMPADFDFPDRETEFFLPFAFSPEQMSDQERGNEFASMLARLAPDATKEQAQAQMQAIFQGIKNRLPDFRSFMDQAGLTTIVTSLHAERIDGVETPLLLLQLCVSFVLLIVCANIANLFLTRVVSRQRELSVRTAVGATRLRIARQLLTESLLMSLVGCIGGILLAYATLDIVRASGMVSTSSIFDIEIDANVLLVTLLLALGAGLLFGLAPVAAALHSRTSEVLKDGGRGMSSGKGARMSRSSLVVAQVTLAVALLVSAGLLMRSFAALQSVDPGFNETGVLSARIALPMSRYPDAQAVHNFQQRLETTIGALPGVTASAMAQGVPFGQKGDAASYFIRGRENDPGAPVQQSVRVAVSSEYFKAMQIGLLQGRSFDSRDRPESQQVVVIDDHLARKHFADSNPLGREITFGAGGDQPDYWTVVGVVKGVKQLSLDQDETTTVMYLPLTQTVQAEFYLVLRTDGNPNALVDPLRDGLQRLDAELPAFDIQALHARINDSLHRQRASMTLLAAFAGIALLLAGIGLYGVLAFSVAQRTGEIGVRMALGADRERVMKLILGQGGRLILAGLGLGLILAVLLGFGLRSMLFGITATDPVVYLSAVVLLALIAFSACAIPSWRAARINPVDALRDE
ncbi:MAG: ABC transporter permease [Woeseia sp.]